MTFPPFDHPTLGKVEIGGWRPGVRLNPPIDQVAAISEAHAAFLQTLAGKLARLAINEVKVVPSGGGLYSVSAVVENTGFLPTALTQGVRTQKAPPVLVRLNLGNAKLLTGRPFHQIDTLAGSGGRQTFRWLVQAPDSVKSITLEASCPRAGRAVRTVELR
jgi:hypothetical protein